MPDKKQVIAQTRHNKRVPNKALKDLTKKESRNPAVPPSYLTFANVSLLQDKEELHSIVSHVIVHHGHIDESVKRSADHRNDTITYEMLEKKLCLDIAHHVVDSLKHFHPKMEMHNPKDNEFYRITVTFQE